MVKFPGGKVTVPNTSMLKEKKDIPFEVKGDKVAISHQM